MGLVIAAGLYVFVNAQTEPGKVHLTHEWTFEDGSPEDGVGDAHGILIGDASIIDGDLVTAGDAGESFQCLEIDPTEIAINEYTEASMEAWFTNTDNAPTWQMVVYLGDSLAGLGANGWFISPIRGDDVLRAAISTFNDGAPYGDAESGVNYDYGETPEPLDVMYHCITAVDADSIYMYVNGVKIGAADLVAKSNSLADVGLQLAWIGRGGYTGDANYNGLTHKVAIYDKALTADEALWLYELGPEAYPTTGIKDIENSLSPNIYSANGRIRIDYKVSTIVNSIEVYDISGRLAYITNKRVNEINLQTSGVYFVVMKSNLGTYREKIAIIK